MTDNHVALAVSIVSIFLALLSLVVSVTNTVLARRDRQLRAREAIVHLTRSQAEENTWTIVFRNLSAETIVIEAFTCATLDARLRDTRRAMGRGLLGKIFTETDGSWTRRRPMPRGGWRSEIRHPDEDLPLPVQAFGRADFSVEIDDPDAVWLQAVVETAIGDRFYSRMYGTDRQNRYDYIRRLSSWLGL